MSYPAPDHKTNLSAEPTTSESRSMALHSWLTFLRRGLNLMVEPRAHELDQRSKPCPIAAYYNFRQRTVGRDKCAARGEREIEVPGL